MYTTHQQHSVSGALACPSNIPSGWVSCRPRRKHGVHMWNGILYKFFAIVQLHRLGLALQKMCCLLKEL